MSLPILDKPLHFRYTLLFNIISPNYKKKIENIQADIKQITSKKVKKKLQLKIHNLPKQYSHKILKQKE